MVKNRQEMQNLFQNTTINGSIIELNKLGGAYLGSYCNMSNITVNGSVFRENLQDGLTIESCGSTEMDWFYIEPAERIKLKSKYSGYKIYLIFKLINLLVLNI